jgi:hypothetical protein
MKKKRVHSYKTYKILAEFLLIIYVWQLYTFVIIPYFSTHTI